MVKFSSIIQANTRFASENAQKTGLVCVFAGATSGIGAGTIEKMAIMFQGATFYILGRSVNRFAPQLAKLEGLNPSLKLVFLEVEVSLISAVDAVCKKIVAVEKQVDYLYMSQGGFPIHVPQYTKEGLDAVLAVQYFSRIRLLSNLLPLLRASPHPRVLSCMNGGNETQILESDLGLENPANYSWKGAVDQMTMLTTLVMEHLSENDKNITFIHSFPGLVKTDNFTHLKAPEDSGSLAKLLVAVMSSVAWTAQRVLGISILDCGARNAWILTNEEYGPGQLWRVGENCEPAKGSVVLERYRERGWRDRVWEYTVGVFERVLATDE